MSDGPSNSAAIAMCVGSSCRKRPEHQLLRDSLGPDADVIEMRCCGICTGPVVVVDARSERPLVLVRMRSRKTMRDIVRVARGSHRRSKRLRRAHVTGSARERALKQLRRAIRR